MLHLFAISKRVHDLGALGALGCNDCLIFSLHGYINCRIPILVNAKNGKYGIDSALMWDGNVSLLLISELLYGTGQVQTRELRFVGLNGRVKDRFKRSDDYFRSLKSDRSPRDEGYIVFDSKVIVDIDTNAYSQPWE
jgi:hypothetical protein